MKSKSSTLCHGYCLYTERTDESLALLAARVSSQLPIREGLGDLHRHCAPNLFTFLGRHVRCLLNWMICPSDLYAQGMSANHIITMVFLRQPSCSLYRGSVLGIYTWTIPWRIVSLSIPR